MKTKREFARYFRSELLPLVRERFEQDGRVDGPARREAWHDAVGALVEDRVLPRRAVDWTPPY